MLRLRVLRSLASMHASRNPVGSVRSFAKKKKRKRAEAAESVSSPGEDDGEGAFDMASATTKMTNAAEWFEREIAKVQTGAARADMLDHVMVDAYGGSMALPQVGQVSVQSARQLLVTVFDPELTKSVDSALRGAELELNPQIDGTTVKVPIPKTTKETRAAQAKLVGKHSESAKSQIRRARKSAMDGIKGMKGDASEDDLKRQEKEVQKLTDAHTKRVDDATKQKQAELQG